MLIYKYPPQPLSSPETHSHKSPRNGLTRHLTEFIKHQMAEQLDNSINSLVVGQVDVQIHRLYQDTTDNWKKVFPTLSHQLPFLTLALKNLEKRKADFSKNSQEVWEQLIQLMRDIRQWDNKPSLIDLSVATKVVELITKLVSFRQSQPITGDTTRPEQDTRALTKIALSCARKV